MRGGGPAAPPPAGSKVYSQDASTLGYRDGVGTQALFGREAGFGLQFTNWNNNPLFVLSDGRNHLIRGIDAVTYRVSTLAGGRGLAPAGFDFLNNMFPPGQFGLADGVCVPRLSCAPPAPRPARPTFARPHHA